MKRERRLENLKLMVGALEAGGTRDAKELRSLLKNIADARDRNYDLGDFLQGLNDLYSNDAVELKQVMGSQIVDYQGFELNDLELSQKANFYSKTREERKEEAIDMTPFLEHFEQGEEDLLMAVDRTDSGLRTEYLVSNFPREGEARIRMRVEAPGYGNEELEELYNEFLEPYVDKIWGDRIETLLDREEETGSPPAAV